MMSDTNSPSPAAGEAGTQTESRNESRSADEGRSSERSEGWFDRLMVAVGLRPSTADLRESLEEVLSDTAAAGDGFSSAERELLLNILHLRETRVEDVMVPRADVLAVPEDVTLTELMLAFTRSAHSRMPVFRETLDDANAVVHIRDLMEHITTGAEQGNGSLDFARVDLNARLKDLDLMRPVLSVPASMPATDLLARMRADHIQMALVIDEYGGVEGLVSMEDIVEAVVGDIEDEHDADEEAAPEIVVIGPGAWSIDGLTELEEVTEATGVSFAALLDEEEEIETLGGVVFALHGMVPPVGEILTSEDLPDVTFEVLEADARRVKRVALRRVDPDQANA